MKHLVLLCIGLFIGCERGQPVLERGRREPLDNRRHVGQANPRVFTDDDLDAMASYQPREGIGMNFYYDELRKRNDAKWAKEELERRRSHSPRESK